MCIYFPFNLVPYSHGGSFLINNYQSIPISALSITVLVARIHHSEKSGESGDVGPETNSFFSRKFWFKCDRHDDVRDFAFSEQNLFPMIV